MLSDDRSVVDVEDVVRLSMLNVGNVMLSVMFGFCMKGINVIGVEDMGMLNRRLGSNV